MKSKNFVWGVCVLLAGPAFAENDGSSEPAASGSSVMGAGADTGTSTGTGIRADDGAVSGRDRHHGVAYRSDRLLSNSLGTGSDTGTNTNTDTETNTSASADGSHEPYEGDGYSPTPFEEGAPSASDSGMEGF